MKLNVETDFSFFFFLAGGGFAVSSQPIILTKQFAKLNCEI